MIGCTITAQDPPASPGDNRERPRDVAREVCDRECESGAIASTPPRLSARKRSLDGQGRGDADSQPRGGDPVSAKSPDHPCAYGGRDGEEHGRSMQHHQQARDVVTGAPAWMTRQDVKPSISHTELLL
jgi:hypothetical protein